MQPNKSNLPEFLTYFTPHEAAEELRRRRSDHELMARTEAFLQHDIPDILRLQAHVCLGRNIATANREAERLVTIAGECGLPPLYLEHHQDQFVRGNLDKGIILEPRFMLPSDDTGNTLHARVKLASFRANEDKPFADIKTTWGVPIETFHHNVISARYPKLTGAWTDLSPWLARHGKHSHVYYRHYLALFVCHAILIESYNYTHEDNLFCSESVLPAYRDIFENLGVRPLLVELAPPGHVHDPFWWLGDLEALHRTQELIPVYPGCESCLHHS